MFHIWFQTFISYCHQAKSWIQKSRRSYFDISRSAYNTEKKLYMLCAYIYISRSYYSTSFHDSVTVVLNLVYVYYRECAKTSYMTQNETKEPLELWTSSDPFLELRCGHARNKRNHLINMSEPQQLLITYLILVIYFSIAKIPLLLY
jgi:hypothetical protein